MLLNRGHCIDSGAYLVTPPRSLGDIYPLKVCQAYPRLILVIQASYDYSATLWYGSLSC